MSQTPQEVIAAASKEHRLTQPGTLGPKSWFVCSCGQWRAEFTLTEHAAMLADHAQHLAGAIAAALEAAGLLMKEGAIQVIGTGLAAGVYDGAVVYGNPEPSEICAYVGLRPVEREAR